MLNSAIEWTDHTYNHWIGCNKVSQGCKNCYAEMSPPSRMSRVKLWGNPKESIRAFTQTEFGIRKANELCKRLGTRERVFANSLSDVFEDNEYLLDKRKSLWRLIEETSSLDWLLLTKRPENIRGMVPNQWLNHWPNNCSVGTSIENKAAIERTCYILDLPTTFKWLSLEPLLEPVGFNEIWSEIDWLIVGGESGINARECHVEWIEQIINEALPKTKIAIKQLGSNAVYQGKKLNLPDKGQNLALWPRFLREYRENNFLPDYLIKRRYANEG